MQWFTVYFFSSVVEHSSFLSLSLSLSFDTDIPIQPERLNPLWHHCLFGLFRSSAPSWPAALILKTLSIPCSILQPIQPMSSLIWRASWWKALCVARLYNVWCLELILMPFLKKFASVIVFKKSHTHCISLILVLSLFYSHLVALTWLASPRQFY